jgi:hypothetical protein
MTRPVCADEEPLLHAILSTDYDDGELSSLFFEGTKVSVKRLSVESEESAIEKLKSVLEKPSKGVSVKGYATFVHADLKVATAKYVETNADLRRSQFKIWVEEDPQNWNNGHAEVVPKVSRGLSNYLFDNNFFKIREL